MAPETEKKKGKQTLVRLWTVVDKSLLCCMVAGALPLLFAMVPIVFWRKAPQNPAMGLRFPTHRMMSPLSVTDQMQKGIMWARLARTMCEKSRLFNSPDPLTAVANMAVMAYPKASSLGGCATWATCKAHIISRCNTYRTFHIVGIVFTILSSLATICACGGAILMNSEGGQHVDALKKMKSKAREKALDKEKENKVKTLMAAASAFVFSVSGMTAWIACSTFGLHDLKEKSFYPYMFMTGPGYFLAVGGVVCFFCAFIAAVVRNKRTVIPDEDQTDEQQPDGYGAASASPGNASVPPPPPPF